MVEELIGKTVSEHESVAIDILPCRAAEQARQHIVPVLEWRDDVDRIAFMPSVIAVLIAAVSAIGGCLTFTRANEYWFGTLWLLFCPYVLMLLRSCCVNLVLIKRCLDSLKKN
jgi:hypothetical protein